MTELFLNIINMSISASWIVLAVLVLRLLLKKAPKWISVLLWAVVGIRLVCPFTLKSVLSLIPSAETVPPEIMQSPAPAINSGVSALNNVINPVITESFAPTAGASANPLQIIIPVMSQIWLLGLVGMLVYTAVSYAHLHRRISTAIRLCDNVYQSESVVSPFVLGIIKPKIYLPFSIDESAASHVIAHEKAHLHRGDHLWKPLGFFILALHWFNPLMWLGYALLCRDIELACDEKVIKELDRDARADYSEALVACSVNRRMIAACPLAFGEVGVKGRVKSVLSYKKPAFWIITVAMIASIAVAVCFLTSPENEGGLLPLQSGTEKEGVSLEIVKTELSFPDPYIEIKWINDTGERIIFGEEFRILYENDGAWENCSIVPEPVWELVAYFAEANSSVTRRYKLSGQTMTALGKYRFEAPFSFDKKAETEYTAWVEFELRESVELLAPHTYKPIKLVYDDGKYSLLQTIDIMPTYIIANGMQLFEKTDNIRGPMGTFVESVLNNNTFDSRFTINSDENPWLGDEKIDDLKKNNKRFWELYGAENKLYVLLEQNDGALYIGRGYYIPSVPEKSHIRWLYKVKEISDGSKKSATELAQLGVYTDAYTDGLKVKYPHYFGLSAESGLDVYIWQMSANSYSCHLVESTPNASSAQLFPNGEFFPSSASLWEMKAIIADYIKSGSVRKDDVHIYPTSVAYSSYYYKIDDEYKAAVTKLFWEEFPGENMAYNHIIDAAVFDIDKDGDKERCVLSFGPTSGLYTVRFDVYDLEGSKEAKYSDICSGLAFGQTSFELKDGETKIKVLRQSDGTELWFSISVRDGHMVIMDDESGKESLYW